MIENRAPAPILMSMESLLRLLHIDATSWPFAIASVATILAAVSDFRSYRIPNRLTFTLVAVGTAYHSVLPTGNGWLFSVSGLGIGVAILLPFFVLGGMGAGDVKLLGAIGCCVGPHDILAVFLAFGSLVGVYSAGVLLFRRRSPAIPAEGKRVEEVLNLDETSRPAQLIPLAPMMALAMLGLAVGSLWPWHGVDVAL